jgi:hypothetical protein
LTISTTSVTDYFAAKLKAKKAAGGNVWGLSEPAVTQEGSGRRDDDMHVVPEASPQVAGSVVSNTIDPSGSTETEADFQHSNITAETKDKERRKARKEKKAKQKENETEEQKGKEKKKRKRDVAIAFSNIDAETVSSHVDEQFLHDKEMHDVQSDQANPPKTDKLKESNHSSRKKKKRKMDTE